MLPECLLWLLCRSFCFVSLGFVGCVFGWGVWIDCGFVVTGFGGLALLVWVFVVRVYFVTLLVWVCFDCDLGEVGCFFIA